MDHQEAAMRYLVARAEQEAASQRLVVERSAEAAEAFLHALRAEHSFRAVLLGEPADELSPRSANRSPRA